MEAQLKTQKYECVF